MQITEGKDLKNLKNNSFRGSVPELINSSINFEGENNILVCERGVTLKNSNITFHSNNSILFLSSNSHRYFVNISLNKSNVCFIGRNNYFNGLTTIVLSEAKNVVIGDDCMFSYNVVIRVSDGHVIYSSKTKERLNYSKSIYIGDHVWFGQNVMVFKGARVGSGSIVGANSTISNKDISSNSTVAGNPVKLIAEDTFWTSDSTHGWGEKEINQHKNFKNDVYIYEPDSSSLDLDDVENELNTFANADSVLYYINNNVLDVGKNRFAFKSSSFESK